MSDPRTTPVNDRVIAAHLGPGNGGQCVIEGEAHQVREPVVDLLRQPDGPRDRQLLLGDSVTRYEDRNGWSFVQAAKDGYVGYVRSDTLSVRNTPTHWVSAPATHVYETPDLKSPDRMALHFGSTVLVTKIHDRFAETSFGFIPRMHLSDTTEEMDDPVSVAALFLGTPYLWGGNSRTGIDCSGLIQASLLASGHACPADSDQQQSALGRTLDKGTRPQRGDLMFWKGHVAWVVAPDRLLHANAHHMAVAYEPLGEAVARIEAQGEGPVVAHKRL